ncbi:hypothetical protein HSBAA_PA_0710 (plasmid) [Vreelandella sulfidaeris]|uniref:Cation efflux protein transmembrane domain-containing protein n=1 Tax=Vreelandella sulfidaeris TaxID=115553 RepID=A0A455UMB6_9GAMM|nr:hypothetical protein HSBAA_PA_0710 [Halomonas sulfidaeris]
MSDHDHSHSGGKTLLFALVFTTGFAAVEVFGGLIADSLALLSDAGHMLTDSLSLGLVPSLLGWPRSQHRVSTPLTQAC